MDDAMASMGSIFSMLIQSQMDKAFKMRPAGKIELTDECQHYESRDQVPWDIQKYFAQRYSIFSLYDEGIWMTDDAWFGVTPEPVAKAVANDMYGTDENKTILIDMFAGAGGNTIAFANSERWERIIAIEKDISTLACAQHNADVYEVESDIITWVHGDSFEFLDALRNRPGELHPDLRLDMDTTVVFASPPWGGPGYSTDEVFDLRTMQPYSLKQLHGIAGPMNHALYLPRNSDIRQIAKLAPEDQKIEIVQYCMEGASKAMVAYMPGASNLGRPKDDDSLRA
ncbi:Trimethylguanosine synthase-like protein [Emericellopsis cladophorae]|uniref:Trimethylguanosine synthase n=1 Tax=Emericellopsis cladophorae TaxID=2686198 RepID=A0A9Q0BBU6_9HYPO|nr:Trimethylguanosine synthase-like protein [Emericellopsis cladophorae]KAI6780137.1 Trimethylguanosine synthase-like protein [Emericellopsis cladophorae]